MTTTDDRRIEDLLALIQKTWGYGSLRPLQQPAMQAMLDGRDCLVVLPTGGGKSLCYQAPAYLRSRNGGGPTVVVSPLIALMKDQVDGLRSLGIAAAQLDSSLSADERRMVASDLRNGKLHLLYLSPERLVSGGESLNAMLRDAGVRTFAIDEAHCISHWGHDFRPEYRQLSHLKDLFPGASVHAFTATATTQVRRDIAQQLRLDDPEILVGNFDRPNLTYRILPRQNMLKQVEDMLARHPGEAGIVYTMRRRDVDDLAGALAENKSLGRKVMGYHAGMTPDQRRKAQEAFIEEECDLIVATIAFGMGIDRSNLRFILHTAMPKSIEAYQQETGRAGRDGLEAECVLLYSAQDAMSWKSLVEKSAKEAIAAGTMVDPDYVANACKHIDDMDRFARGAICRHQSLVEYFGQKYQPPALPLDPTDETQSSVLSTQSCKACDVCLGDTTPVPDATVIAQKILSAIARTDQRFGIGHIIAILRGENIERIRQLRHDELPTYGLLRDFGKSELRDFVYQLMGQGALAQESLQLSSGHTAAILKLNRHSIEVLKGQRSVKLLQIVRKEPAEARKTRAAEVSWEGVDRDLFEVLRAFRKQTAAEKSVPPYVIFSDATLRDLARMRPSTLANLRLVYGIGENKLKEFGPQLLPLITQYCRENGLTTDEMKRPPAAAAPPPPPPREPGLALNSALRQAATLFKQGKTIDEVAHALGRAKSTCVQYLAEFIAAERPASVSAWVSDEIYARVEKVWRTLEDPRLKPLFIALDESIPFDTLRIVVAHLQCTCE